MAEIEVIESMDLILEFDHPLPPEPVNYRPAEKLWSKRLGPQRSYPGRTARVMRDIPTYKKGVGIKNNIYRAMRNANKYEDWSVSSRKEENNTWSIYTTFNGVLNETEYQQREVRRAQRWAKIKQGERRNKIEKAQKLGHSLLAGSLTPPTVD